MHRSPGARAAHQPGGRSCEHRVAFLGASFKAGTSDVRDSPALNLMQELHHRGAVPVIYDPQGLESARRIHPNFKYAESAIAAMKDADIVVLGTEWPKFTTDRQLPMDGAAIVSRRILVDVRNAVQAGPWLAAGWQIWTLGRPVQQPTP